MTSRESSSRPNLFVVGAPKCGTTSVYHYLRGQPWCFMPALKEPHFFSFSTAPHLHDAALNVIRTWDDYLSLFDRARDARYVGDASTSYLHVPGCSTRISRYSADAKIIIYLRDPVERAVSHYWNNVRDGGETRSFREAITAELDAPETRWTHAYVGCSRYAEAVRQYRLNFGSQTYVGFSECLRDNWPAELNALTAHLEVSHEAELSDRIRANIASQPRGQLARVALAPQAKRLARRIVPGSVRRHTYRALMKPAEKPQIDRPTVVRLRNALQRDAEALEADLGVAPPWPRDPASGGTRGEL